MEAGRNKDIMRNAYDRLFNQKDIDFLDEFLAEDFVEHAIPPELASGDDPADVKAWFTEFFAAFPDIRVTVQQILVDDDRCVGHLMLTGTHEGEFLGLPPTGREVTWEWVDIIRFADGRAAEHWGLSSDLQAYAQLGAVPAIPGMMNTVHRASHDAFNARDWDAMLAPLADEGTFVDHPRSLTMKAPAAFLDWAKEWVAAASDASVQDRHYTESAGMSMCRFRGRGTQDGPLGPFPASGNRFDLAFCEVLHFDDAGRVTGSEIYYDQMNLLIQLGHVPPPTA
jgi:steroid delta-isomerase-like uncharacterized protein